LHHEARDLAERFAAESLDRIAPEESMLGSAMEIREASLSWMEHHSERRLITRALLETP